MLYSIDVHAIIGCITNMLKFTIVYQVITKGK